MPRPVFRDFGGMYQLRLETAEEIRYIRELDKARWSATSAPLEQFYCDPQVLAYLDTDNNGRIRVHELLEAQQWLYANLTGREGFERGSDELQLSSLDSKAADAAKLKQLAAHMLSELGQGSARSISLAQVRSFLKTSSLDRDQELKVLEVMDELERTVKIRAAHTATQQRQ